jgi:hypothetical protein
MCYELIEKAAVDIPSEKKTKTKTYTKEMVAPEPEEQIVLPSREIEAQPEAPMTPEADEEDSAVSKDEETLDGTTSATAGPAEPPAVPKPNGESTTEPPPSA